MNSFKVSKLLLLVVVILTPTLSYISNFLGAYIKFMDDIIILFLLFYLFPIKITSLDVYPFSLIKLIIFFLIISFLSAIVNYDNFDLISYLVQLKNYFFTFAIFLFAVFLYDERYFKSIVKLYLFLSFILAFIGILEYIFEYHFYKRLTPFGDILAINPFRSYSLIGNPVDFAFYLILPFIISIMNKRYFLSFFFLISIGTTLSLGVLSIIFVLSFVAVISKTLNKKIFILIIIISSFFVLNNETINSRILGKIEKAKFSSYNEEASRLNFYRQSLDILKDNILVGVGVGNFGGWASQDQNTVYQSQRKNYVYEKYNFKFYSLTSIDVFYPHLLGEIGLFGFLIYLNFYFKIIIKTYRISKYFIKTNDSYGYIISVSTYLYGIALLYSGFWSMFLETSFATIVYFFLSGYIHKYFENRKIKFDNKNMKNININEII